MAVEANLIKIEEYRNSIAHFYHENMEPHIFMLTARCALNYADFVKLHFEKDIISEDGLFILPLGFKLPFKPQDYLSKKAASNAYSNQAEDFIKNIIKTTNDLKEHGVEDSIVLGFGIYLESVKKINNSDLLVAITSTDNADVSFVKTSKYQVVNEPGAMKVSLSEEDISNNFPLDYKGVLEKCKEEVSEFKQNDKFHTIMRKLKEKPVFCFTRKLDPRNNKTSTKTFYSKSIVDEIKKEYKQ